MVNKKIRLQRWFDWKLILEQLMKILMVIFYLVERGLSIYDGEKFENLNYFRWNG